MPDELVLGFNIRSTPRSRSERHIYTQNPTLKMTSTKIEVSFNKIARLNDLADMAELLFPGNRNQQHASLAVWIALKWADHHMVPNLGVIARKHGISKRTLERVRAKMRRMGLIDHVSRFGARHGYQEGWVLSNRFERALQELACKVADLKDASKGSRDKDGLLLEYAETRHRASRQSDNQLFGGGEDVQAVIQEIGR